MHAINLFCGGGGFASGAERAGIAVEAAYDIDTTLTTAHKINFPETALHLGDIADLSGADVVESAEADIDLVFGGPPCQAFSNIGLRDAADPRRFLLGHFFRLVSEINPAVFVMENVIGLTQGNMRDVLDAGIEIVSKRYQVLDPFKLDASDFGAATKRKRIFVVGYDPRKCDAIGLADIKEFRAPATTVADAIRDLEGAKPCKDGDGRYDTWLLRSYDRISAYAESLRSEDRKITSHRLTAHTRRVTNRFRALSPGEVDAIGRHPRLAWSGQCPTLRAGTGPERGSYQSVRPIHPVHPRVITVREAARLQGFSDRHLFHPTIWHSFRIIGNSVSPFVAEAIFRAIASRCEVSGDVDDIRISVAA